MEMLLFSLPRSHGTADCKARNRASSLAWFVLSSRTSCDGLSHDCQAATDEIFVTKVVNAAVVFGTIVKRSAAYQPRSRNGLPR